jgi:hypothetical protein
VSGMWFNSNYSTYFDAIKDKILSEAPPNEMDSEDITSESDMLLAKFEQII